MDEPRNNLQWIIVELLRQQFGLPAWQVRELVVMPEISAVPGLPEYLRGVMNLRGRVIPVVDLRLRLGMPSRHKETESFCALMQQRQQDHVKWLAELDASVREDREFRLATDPHLCAFGKWYYGYKADDSWIKSLLLRFERPHSEIHAAANVVLALRTAGDRNAALNLIEQKRRNVLALMLDLFERLRQLIREVQAETAVVLETNRNVFAVSVDAALSLEKFAEEDLEPMPVAAGASITQIGRKGRAGRPVLLLAADRLFEYALT